MRLTIDDWDGRVPADQPSGVPGVRLLASGCTAALIIGLCGVYYQWGNLEPKLGWVGAQAVGEATLQQRCELQEAVGWTL